MRDGSWNLEFRIQRRSLEARSKKEEGDTGYRKREGTGSAAGEGFPRRLPAIETFCSVRPAPWHYVTFNCRRAMAATADSRSLSAFSVA
jgi:hypothetical protein